MQVHQRRDLQFNFYTKREARPNEQGGARGRGFGFVGDVRSAGESHLSCYLACRTGVEPGLAVPDRCGQLADGNHFDLGRDGRSGADLHDAARIHSVDLRRAIADNFSRRHVMAIGWCVIALSSIMLTALVAMGYYNLWMILALSCLAGCGAAFSRVRRLLGH